MLSVLIAAHTVEENNRIRHQLEEQMHFEDARIIDAMSEIEYPMDIPGLLERVDNGWLWILTDYVELNPCAIAIILGDIAEFGDEFAIAIQYNIYGDLQTDMLDEYIFMDSLESFVNGCDTLYGYGNVTADQIQKTLTGCSNRVYNLAILRPFIKYAVQYAVTMAPGIVPVLKALERRAAILIHHNSVISSETSLIDRIDIRDVCYNLAAIDFIRFKMPRRILDRMISFFVPGYMTVISDYISGGFTDLEYLLWIYDHAYSRFLDDKAKEFFERIITLAKTGEDIVFLTDLISEG